MSEKSNDPKDDKSFKGTKEQITDMAVKTELESKKEKKPDEITQKKCGLCDEVIQGENGREVSKFMAIHLEKVHPEPEEPDPIEKKTFKATCDTCDREVQSNTKEGLESLMRTHSLSHEHESEIDKKEKKENHGNVLLVVAGLAVLIIGATMVFGTLWQNSKKRALDK